MLRRTIPALGLLALMLASGPASTPAFAQSEKAETHPTPVPAQAEAKEGLPALEHDLTRKTDEAGNPNIMEVQSPLALWTVVVFGGLMLVLGRFAWKPLMHALHERESHLQQVLVDSERARNEAEALAAKNRKELAAAADQVRALIDEARKEAQVAANSIIEKAQAEAESSRQRAEREIAGAKDQALMEIWSSTADLAVSVAGKVLGKELGESDHRRLVEMAMGELPANGHGREGSRS
jgi:F-type H+-transporting ATPase subunit b